MSEPVRLSRLVADLVRCSRREAEQYIEGGWVSVDGTVVEEPQFTVAPDAQVSIAQDAVLEASEPATMLLHKPAGVAFADCASLVIPAEHAEGDLSGIRELQRHYRHLAPLMVLDDEASGLVVVSQDERVLRRFREDGAQIEQEFVVEVSGKTGPYTLGKLSRGLSYQGRALPPCKVSWQNEVRLRFAIHDVRPGQLRHMCNEVGLDVVAIRRIRIGRVSMGKMPAAQWRYQPPADRF
ncbi:rRNA pseudouridine synthase [Montanilutibacter psychrotolerans]|uniref:Dual-specificity RNA pseudouridine synthase RluF n=1 Tax=Montanilutibacter psychrotolerans TaxID=1327343 RepID=A0A3M8SP81_9GAMM|nr:rRNA pseudouridine synthase [Lysobacter psychrotolerans]RNF83127.1 RNA-binding protein [Lysobacter psychrotolerans]